MASLVVIRVGLRPCHRRRYLLPEYEVVFQGPYGSLGGICHSRDICHPGQWLLAYPADVNQSETGERGQICLKSTHRVYIFDFSRSFYTTPLHLSATPKKQKKMQTHLSQRLLLQQ